ncbi:hypothetical protein N8500_07520 [Candidatus Puniceispirillum sp.]|nr:hypothetical protein [Candidatus Puniceispirillum sp.]
MANPSLKAQIEAARSALARTESKTSTVSVSTQIAKKFPAEQATQQVLSQEQASNSTANIRKQTSKKTFESDAAGIDARITSLEEKLLASQKDLHKLLNKIREITDFQGDIKKRSDAPEKIAVNLSFRRYLSSITITFSIIMCLIFSIIYFLTTKQDLLQLWINQLGKFISKWIG